MAAGAAVRIALWLNATKVCEDSDGGGGLACTWPMNSTDTAPQEHPYVSTTLYYGALGTAIFLRQLSDSLQEPEDGQWRNLTAAALEGARLAVDRALPDYGANAGFYYGLAGVAYGFRAAAARGGNASTSTSARYEEVAAGLEGHIIGSVAPFSNASGATLWNNTDVAHGAAGTGLYLLWLSRQPEVSVPAAARQAAFDGAVRAGEWLLQRAEAVPGGGLRWARGPDTDGAHDHSYYPTFCCGGAGVSYFLSELSQATAAPAATTMAKAQARRQQQQSAAFLDAAERGAAHVLALGFAPEGVNVTGGGLLVPHEEEGAGLTYACVLGNKHAGFSVLCARSTPTHTHSSIS
jgi:hypothetical protein